KTPSPTENRRRVMRDGYSREGQSSRARMRGLVRMHAGVAAFQSSCPLRVPLVSARPLASARCPRLRMRLRLRRETTRERCAPCSWCRGYRCRERKRLVAWLPLSGARAVGAVATLVESPSSWCRGYRYRSAPCRCQRAESKQHAPSTERAITTGAKAAKRRQHRAEIQASTETFRALEVRFAELHEKTRSVRRTGRRLPKLAPFPRCPRCVSRRER